MCRNVVDALARHQASMAALEEEHAAKLAELEEAHKADLDSQQGASEAALQSAKAEMAEFVEQAAAALASRPEQAQYVEVTYVIKAYTLHWLVLRLRVLLTLRNMLCVLKGPDGMCLTRAQACLS